MVKYKQSLFKTPTIKQVLLPGHLVANILTTVLPNPVPSPSLCSCFNYFPELFIRS